ncbi:4909_t:CDS:1, partial [Acaulospora colombiana]
TIGNQLPQEHDISSPEMKKGGWNALKELPSGVSDAYALGILLNSVFNLTTTPPATVHPPHTVPTASSRGNIPTNIFPLFKKLLNPSSKPRLTCQAFLEIGMGERAGVDGVPGRFFVDNHLVRVCSQLEGFPLASDGEKAEFLR